MAEQSKSELIAELERARERLSESLRGVTHSLDLQARFRDSVGRNKALWFSGAAVMGWVLSRLPGRKKKAELRAAKHVEQNTGESRNTGIMLPLLKFGVTILKPAITAYATKKIANMAMGNDRDAGRQP